MCLNCVGAFYVTTHIWTSVVLCCPLSQQENTETNDILILGSGPVSDGLFDAECGRWFVITDTHQDEVRLIRRQHEYRDVVVGQRCYDWFRDFGDSDGLRTGGTAAPRHHVERQPCGIGNTDVLRLRQLWEQRRYNVSERGGHMSLERRWFPLIVGTEGQQHQTASCVRLCLKCLSSAASVLEKMHRWW